MGHTVHPLEDKGICVYFHVTEEYIEFQEMRPNWETSWIHLFVDSCPLAQKKYLGHF